MQIPRRKFMQGTLAMGAAALLMRSARGLTPSHRASVVDFGADPTGAKDSTLAVQTAIASLLPDDSRLVFPAGQYRFEASTDAAMVLRGFTGLEVYANNAEMRFSGGSAALRLASCKSVALHDMRLGWQEASGSSNTSQPSVFFERCDDVLVEGVSIKGAPGAGLVLHDCRNLQIENIRMTGNARSALNENHAMVLQDCHGDVRIRDSSLEGMCGDGIRIYQSYWKVERRIDDRTIQIKGSSSETPQSFQLPRAGDFVQFSSPTDLRLLGEIAVASSSVEGGRGHLVFSERLSPVIVAGVLLCGVVDGPKATVEHCSIARSGGRGMVVHARTDVSNCHFEGCARAAVLLAPSLQRMEGPVVQNINLRASTFERCNEGAEGGDRGVVVIAAHQDGEHAQMSGTGTVNSGVRIESNTFHLSATDANHASIYAADVYGLVIEKNKFDCTPAAGAGPSVPTAIVLSNVTNADLALNVSNVATMIEMKQCADTVAVEDNQLMTVRRLS